MCKKDYQKQYGENITDEQKEYRENITDEKKTKNKKLSKTISRKYD